MDKDIAALKTCLTKDIFIDDQTWVRNLARALSIQVLHFNFYTYSSPYASHNQGLRYNGVHPFCIF